jgi:PAS domain-containing protein
MGQSLRANLGHLKRNKIPCFRCQHKDSILVETPLTMQEARPTPGSHPPRPSPRNSSTTSLMAHLQRDFSRPFSDTIAQLMLNSIPLHLFLAKPHSGEVIWTNTKFDAYRRCQPQEPRVRDPWQSVHPGEVEHIAKEWTKALRTGSQFTGRVRVKRFNDEAAYRWFIFRANPLLSATGELLYWIGSFLDIHEQHTAELQAAQEREIFATDAKYRALANSIPQVVFEAAENYGIISANEQWHLYTGQTTEEAMNFGFTKHVHRDDLERCGLISSEHVEPLAQPVATDPTLSPGSHVPSSRSLDGRRIFSRRLTSALNALVERGVVAAQKRPGVLLHGNSPSVQGW